MQLDDSDPRSFPGLTLYTNDETVIGEVREIFEDGMNPHTYWASVGLADDPDAVVLVPAAEVRNGRRGPTLPYPREVVMSAPRVQPSSGEVSGDGAVALYEHYRDHHAVPPAPPHGEETPSPPDLPSPG